MTDQASSSESIIRSRQRVADHGEVLTPSWLVENMLDLVQPETERIDSRFLEPACGSGNFLLPILRRKLEAVRRKYNAGDFETRQYSLLALMCIYGVELLADNVKECRKNLLNCFAAETQSISDVVLLGAAATVVDCNIIQGDALDFRTPEGSPIVFSEWAYLGHGRFQRRDFRYDTLTQRSSLGGIFEEMESHEIFSALREYPPMTIHDLAQ